MVPTPPINRDQQCESGATVVHGESEGDSTGTTAAPRMLTPATVGRMAWVTFAVLFFMNLLDYTDRFVLSGMLKEVRDDLQLSNTQSGLLATWFLVSYSIVSPIMGYAGDRFRRTRLLAIGASESGAWRRSGAACAAEATASSPWRARSWASARRPTV